MVVDSFMIFNELDMLEIRLNILNPYVDKFVITEATQTQMGHPKPMYFQNNKERFKKFEEKIVYNPIDMGSLSFPDQWHREQYQKNCCIYGIEKTGVSDNDIVMFSDLDEIPNPITLQQIIDDFDPERIYHFAQDMFYFYLNYKNIDGSLLAACGDFPGVTDTKWLGSKLCSYKTLREFTCDGIRNKPAINENAVRVPDGGWHFTYMGGSGTPVQERIKEKLGAFSHSEFNKWRFYNKAWIKLSILLGRDLLGRNARFKKVPLDDTYPEWLRENASKYPHLILG